jgi:hypothetical protein
MAESKPRPRRNKEILHLVKNHGPLSIDMIFRMIDPPMQKKNLRQCLGIMRRKNLIDTLSADSQTTYYQIFQSLPSRRQIAEVLGCSPEDAIRPLLRRQDWLHNQWCEYWALSIKRIIPEAQIVREHMIGSHDIAMRILNLTKSDFELVPDFLLTIPKTDSTEVVNIAFEIERTRKSNKRILRKFNKYMNGTLIDGLIYICDSGRLSETIRELYQTKLIVNNLRVRHYGDHFFLFSDSLDGSGPDLSHLYNAKGELISFQNWISYLQKTKWTLRRDAELPK